MKLTHNGLSAVLAVSLVVCSSCRKKQTPPVMMPPAVTRSVPETTPGTPPPPPDIPPSQSATAVKPPPNVAAQTQPPPPPPKKKKKPARKQATAQNGGSRTDAQGAAAQPANGQPQATAVPLRQMLSEETRKQYETRVNEALGNARATLRNARARSNLTPAQQNMAAQVATFVQQAEDARTSDIVASRSLAERAELLAHDLADTLQ